MWFNNVYIFKKFNKINMKYNSSFRYATFLFNKSRYVFYSLRTWYQLCPNQNNGFEIFLVQVQEIHICVTIYCLDLLDTLQISCKWLSWGKNTTFFALQCQTTDADVRDQNIRWSKHAKRILVSVTPFLLRCLKQRCRK